MFSYMAAKQESLLHLTEQPRLTAQGRRDLLTILPFPPENHKQFYKIFRISTIY